MEKLNLFFNQIKQISLWQRIFFWGRIRALSYDAFTEYHQLAKEHGDYRNDLDELKAKYNELEHEKIRIDDALGSHKETQIKHEAIIKHLNEKVVDLNNKVTTLNRELAKFEAGEESRQTEHKKAVNQMLQAREKFESDLDKMHEEELQEQEERIEAMRE